MALLTGKKITEWKLTARKLRSKRMCNTMKSDRMELRAKVQWQRAYTLRCRLVNLDIFNHPLKSSGDHYRRLISKLN